MWHACGMSVIAEILSWFPHVWAAVVSFVDGLPPFVVGSLFGVLFVVGFVAFRRGSRDGR